MENISTIGLYQLFMKNQIVKIKIQDKFVEPTTPVKQIIRSPLTSADLTPISKSIYESASTPDKPHLLREFSKDNEIIESILNDLSDPDYIDKELTYSELGFYMEDYLSITTPCPVCNKLTLRPYARKNMPAVDMICINKEYHIKNPERELRCYLFQVKTSINESSYFVKDNYITVGSIRSGYNCHVVSGNALLKDKFIIPGYICIQLIGGDGNYKVNRSGSFTLIPDYYSSDDEPYYNWKFNESPYRGLNRNMITYNPSLVKTSDLPSNLTGQIETALIFSRKIIDNPYFIIPDCIYENKQDEECGNYTAHGSSYS